ncbi:MAG: hypothetical protein GXO39_01920 [Thermotogae bacterium]|nr:hypothetical protein [Thermotogota bacterium]
MANLYFITSETLNRDFQPLVRLRDLEDIRIGVFTFRERWKLLVGDSKEDFFIKTGVILHELPDSEVVGLGGEVLAVRTSDPRKAKEIFERGAYEGREVKGVWIRAFWEIPDVSLEILEADLNLLLKFRRGEFYRYDSVWVHRSVSLRSVVVEGEGVIDEGARIGPYVFLKGPFYIGRGTLLKPFTSLNSSVLGPICKVGGEVSHSVFDSYSNKQHGGFIGHSYVGQWVNVGAGSEVSNLKNTYGEVKVFAPGRGEVVDTGKRFLGAFLADHSKLGINTTVSTGTVVGIFANVTAKDSPTPRFVPDFYWTGGKRMRLDKAIEVAERVMARRGVKPTQDYLKRIEGAYRKTLESDKRS